MSFAFEKLSTGNRYIWHVSVNTPTTGASPVPLPGTQAGGSQWLSFPFFATTRAATPDSQTDPKNSKPVLASAGFQFYGALIDNNLDDPLSDPDPGVGRRRAIAADPPHGRASMHRHRSGSPIPSGANPATSDKISQRNLAISTVANPGLSASRMAMHTFEIEATPGAITSDLRPDELLFAWPRSVPRGTYVSLHLPGWNAQEVVDLADRHYARHDIRATGAHTIEIPGGGARYGPIPRSSLRQPGVVSVSLPLGIHKGQRFDIWIQQLSNRQRAVKQAEPSVERITLRQAAELLRGTRAGARKAQTDVAASGGVEHGVFDVGKGRSLVTDLSVFDGGGDHALIITHPDSKKAAAARNNSRIWREPIGTFQLGIPVFTGEDMLLYHLQPLSIMLWRFEHLDRKSIWHRSMAYYLELLIEKVLALGGDPYAVPPTPGGTIPQLDGGDGHGRPSGEWDVDCRDEGEQCEAGQALVTVNVFPRGKPRKGHRRH